MTTPIVLVPGLICSAEVFAPQVAALWPYGSVTIASTAGDSIAAMASAILAEAPRRFALGGISMGGYVGLEIMRQAPERVSKLALISTHARPDTPEQPAQRRAMVDQARTGDYAAMLKATTDAVLYPAHRGNAALLDVNVRMGLTVGIDGLARQTEAVIGRVDSRPSLPAIKVPTVIVVGDSDPLAPPERSKEMADAIPGAKLVIVPECGHPSTLEQPDAVNRVLVEWITA